MGADFKLEEVNTIKKASKSRGLPKRFIVTILAFFGLFNAACMKVCVSVAIVAMVDHTEVQFSNGTNSTAECPVLVDQVKTEQKAYEGKRYDWDSIQQGFILSAFFYGYFCAMLPGGYMADRLGPVKVFGCCIFSTSLFTLLSPFVVQWGSVPFILLRFLAGFGEGATYPSVLAIISRWSPKLERSRITSIILTGGSIGMVFSFSVAGLLSASNFLGGWPSVFYVFGTIGCAWYFLWVIFIYESPNVHPTITEEEIEKFKDVSSAKDKGKQNVPWKSILTSLPVWALMFACIGNNFGYIMLMTQIPTYLNSILHFNIKASGALSALPYVSQTVGAWIASFVADKLRSTGKLRITLIRKVFSSIAGYGSAICILTIAFSGCHSYLIVFLLTFGNFLNGSKFSGFVAASVDMTPNFVGIIYGLTSGTGNIAGIIGPTMFGAIIANGATIANWSKVFMTISGIYFFTTTVFAVFGSAELQHWNKTEPVSPKEEKS
ncbi:putative inorganic phosphate cotransporter [Parasteatoda tepidariorum]|uniref:putative inorganic phosphate cotransporter n=1 Tax=Parasteatoda tepidariorum TaxID=114398 RepID=UPI001C72964D|nr:putative inorganic phosphate cotransporter [Parasteatoda tepidariorum]